MNRSNDSQLTGIRNSFEQIGSVSKGITQISAKTRKYFNSKKLETIANLDTRKLVYHLSPVKKLQISALQFLCQWHPELAVSLALEHFTKPRRRLNYLASDLPKGAMPFALPYRNGHLQGYSWGEGPRTIYLVHGWESLLSLMSQFVEPLLEAGFRVVAFDAPGHGHSDTQDTDVVDFSRAIAHVIRRMGEPCGIIAHSCGSAATILMLKRNPDITPEKVVLVAPMPSLQKHVEVFQDIAKLPADIFIRFVKGLEERIGMKMIEADAAMAVPYVRAKGLVIHDLFDSLIPHDAGYRIARSWTCADLITTTGLGHLNILYDASVIANAVEFLGNDITVLKPH